MSLYYDAAPLIGPNEEGSLKSRVFSAKNLKSPPKQVFALVTEASKWSEVLTEVIEKSALLHHERKLSPSIALLLVHDLLLSRKGVSAPSSHPLRLAIERHKARLSAEFTKARLRRGYSNVDALRAKLNSDRVAPRALDTEGSQNADTKASPERSWVQPRWVRVNAIKTTLDEQIATIFASYAVVKSLQDLMTCKSGSKLIYIDENIPNLVAIPPGSEISTAAAYRNGLIILQDKASCFPAYLLGLQGNGKTCLDACAAPGNKTTHMAAILQNADSTSSHSSKIIACERDTSRAMTLQKMVSLAGAGKIVEVRAGQDFLRIDPTQHPWSNVGSVLLDPSCSGSGIVGRDDTPKITLPSKDGGERAAQHNPKKRKRPPKEAPFVKLADEVNDTELADQVSSNLDARLDALSAFQLKLLLHALRFPNVSRLVYSTCSIHAQENEHVVMKALCSPEAVARGWRIMRADEQPAGLRSWPIRGDLSACSGLLPEAESTFVEEVVKSCMRCEKATKAGTQGFFVAGFVRSEKEATAPLEDPVSMNGKESQLVTSTSYGSGSDWEGFESSSSG